MQVRFTISTAGSVKDAAVVKSSNSVFERSALQAVSKWKYQPQMQEGKPAEAPDQQVVAALQDGGMKAVKRVKTPVHPTLRAVAVLLVCALSLAAAGATAKEKDAERGGDGGKQGTGLGKHVAEKLLAANELLQKDAYDDALAIVDELGEAPQA